MNKRLSLVLSALLIASVAISCAPKSHEEQVIATLNTMCDIVSQSKDCGQVAEGWTIIALKRVKHLPMLT